MQHSSWWIKTAVNKSLLTMWKTYTIPATTKTSSKALSPKTKSSRSSWTRSTAPEATTTASSQDKSGTTTTPTSRWVCPATTTSSRWWRASGASPKTKTPRSTRTTSENWLSSSEKDCSRSPTSRRKSTCSERYSTTSTWTSREALQLTSLQLWWRSLRFQLKEGIYLLEIKKSLKMLFNDK